MSLLLLIITFYIISDIHAIEGDALLYAPNDFPNPQKYPNTCAEEPSQSKWLCDPFNYLNSHQQSNLELICESIAKGDYIQSPCSSKSSPNSINEKTKFTFNGFQVGIAINKKVLRTTSSDEGNVNFHRKYAKIIFNNWGIGHHHEECSDGILIYLSIEDRKIEIITGKIARKYLSDNEAEEIIKSMKSYLRDEKYHEALNVALDELQDYLKSEDKFFSFANIIVILILVCFFIGPSLINRWYTKRKVNELLEKIKREKNNKNINKYKTSSCPVCFEDFKDTEQNKEKTKLLESKEALVVAQVLPCGHQFCSSCIKKWINSGNSNQRHDQCPICRKPILESNQIKNEDTWNSELSFRLNQMTRMHQGYFIRRRHVISSLYDTYADRTLSNYEMMRPSNRRDCEIERVFYPSEKIDYGRDSGFGGGSCDGGGGASGSW